MKKRILYIFVAISFISINGHSKEIVLAELESLEKLGVTPISKDIKLGVGYGALSAIQKDMLRAEAHRGGACAGFESFGNEKLFSIVRDEQIYRDLHLAAETNVKYQAQKKYANTDTYLLNSNIQTAVNQLSTQRIEDWVKWLSSFETRFHKSLSRNDHVTQLEFRLQNLISLSGKNIQIEQLVHTNTPQHTLRIRVVGSERPNEIVVLGGHLDSTVGMFGGSEAPGADDNASGSATLLEVFEVLLAQESPKRTVEFFFYAGEEGGLLGSKEVAESYRASGKRVVAVLQLDMVLHPGSGIGTISFVRDFTSDALTDYLKELNSHYVGANVIDTKCGYGCSDHASWHRNGFPAAIPFESSTDDMNKRIHTKDDVINSQSSFVHALNFAKLALAYAMDVSENQKSF